MVVTIALSTKQRKKLRVVSADTWVNHLISISTKCFRLSDYFSQKWCFQTCYCRWRDWTKHLVQSSSHVACCIVKRHDILPESKLVMTCQLFPNENRCWYKNVSSSQTVSLLNLQKIWGILGFWTKLPFPGPNGSIWPLEECISLFDALKVYLQPKMTLCIFSLHRKWYRTRIQARAPSSSVSSLRPTACNCVVSGHSGSHRG